MVDRNKEVNNTQELIGGKEIFDRGRNSFSFRYNQQQPATCCPHAFANTLNFKLIAFLFCFFLSLSSAVWRFSEKENWKHRVTWGKNYIRKAHEIFCVKKKYGSFIKQLLCWPEGFTNRESLSKETIGMWSGCIAQRASKQQCVGCIAHRIPFGAFQQCASSVRKVGRRKSYAATGCTQFENVKLKQSRGQFGRNGKHRFNRRICTYTIAETKQISFRQWRQQNPQHLPNEAG